MKLNALVFLGFLLCFVSSEPPSRKNSRFLNFSRQQRLTEAYGPPQAASPEATVEQDAENIDAVRASKLGEKLLSQKIVQDNRDNGEYYIYHPTGLLQRVLYSTEDNPEKMAFSARLKYENVEPISGPIYTYDPVTFVFRRVK
ncbi:hypothetical protein GWI33_006529 [Rhynchophorus ferrugineus]|uniref:Uncharacterized protein n=1 Tax=Rhynchophorus ferrugineus TaxID=354439 RepID=A0A834IK77_RHYFE|nr:hypothetical protein GWI33_006529 [Rhynchophorus ferrugineus]